MDISLQLNSPYRKPLPHSRGSAAKPADPSGDKVELTSQLPQGGKPRGGTLTGDIRSHRVQSKILDEKRKILVFLPPNYDSEPDRQYKVLYTQDGQNMFDRRTATRDAEWRLDEAGQNLMTTGQMEDVIMVAVYNGGNGTSRRRDYTVASDDRYGGGQAENYLSFLKNELKPMVDATYRTQQGPESTAILGSSLGGHFSLFAGFQAPETFGMVGAMSPSLWYAGQSMLSRLDEATPNESKPSKVWVSMGTEEANPDWSLDPVSEFHQVEESLSRLGYSEEANFFPRLIDGGEHTNTAWSSQAESFLTTMFPPNEETV